MEIQGLQALYAGHKSVKALAKALQDGSARTIFAEGLCASAAPLLFSSVAAALRALGFRRVDYVYEPGQFAVRGSILDVFSFSSEWPYRVDFFGDEVDSIRTFEVQTQLSRDKQEEIVIVPELAGYVQGKVPFTDFLPPETVLVMKDFRRRL